MRVFVKVADRGSFARAADELDISRAAASGHVAALERHLGARLMYRTTRKVSLTAEGADFLRRSRRILDEIKDAEESLHDARLIGTVDAGVLAAAERAGNLVWAMNEVSDSLLRRELYRWQWWYNVATPVAVALLGAAVGFICVALFLPLVALIEGSL